MLEEGQMAPAALSIIRDEHRSLVAVLQGLQFLVRDVHDRGVTPDFELFTLILDYIDMFPEKFHHPKENEHLFKAVRARSADANALLDALESEHAHGDGLVRELRHALARWRVAGPAGFDAFAGAVEAYLDFHWKHMRKEEDVVLPLAERVLTAADWEAIDAAFRANDDPLFGTRPKQEFRKLFSLIVNRAPAPLGVGDPARPAQ
jgi:hemerythrin-like domain-containing protein